MKTWLKYSLIAVAGIFVLIQFIPVERTNPPVTANPPWDSPQTKELARRACFDCHSHETKWPWYSYVAPASWLVTKDVNEGRQHFNISVAKMGEADEAAEAVEKGFMPMSIYLPLHPEAQLTPEEKQALIIGLTKTFGTEKRPSTATPPSPESQIISPAPVTEQSRTDYKKHKEESERSEHGEHGEKEHKE